MHAFNSSKLIKYETKYFNDWKKVVKMGVQILADNNFAKIELANKIINATKKYGPYYVLLPGIALLHAEADNNSIKPSLSLLFLEKEVTFGYINQNRKSANIIFTLSAPNKNDHMDIIKIFAKKLQDKTFVDSLKKVKSKEEILKLFKIKE